MGKSGIVILSMLAAIALCFPPIVPVSALFSLSAETFEWESDSGLSNEDVEEILELVSDHPEFGNAARFGSMISIKDAALTYSEIGVLGVGRIDEDWTGSCNDCSAAVNTGMNCGGLCGVGTYFFLAEFDGVWRVRTTGYWVS